jgi:GntR family transcriptional regulator
MTGTTGYADIAAHYRRLITDGTLVPGDAMPSIRKVRDEFDVTITTANRAFGVLKAEGLTSVRSGVGTVVADRPMVASTGAARLDRLERTGRPLGFKEKSIKHTAALVGCDDVSICRTLEIEPHDEVVRRTRVYTHEDTPTLFSMACIHPRALSAVPEILTPGTAGRFWQHLYTERTGKDLYKSPEMRGARLADRHELEAMDITVPPGASVPVLVLVNVFRDEDGPIEVWQDTYAPGRWQEEGA